MPKYVCNLYTDNSWYKKLQELENLTFDSEAAAKFWFKRLYPLGDLKFSGFHATEQHITSWVTLNGKDIGDITISSD
jgi:hypothetical protein